MQNICILFGSKAQTLVLLYEGLLMSATGSQSETGLVRKFQNIVPSSKTVFKTTSRAFQLQPFLPFFPVSGIKTVLEEPEQIFTGAPDSSAYAKLHTALVKVH